ncbi:MAG: aminopeptidase P family protein [Clostridia bacterium]|nr:aminopeptidase P family protein [Clostridia bacterium]
MTEKIAKIQQLLAQYNLDGWLFTDYHGHDHITKDFLALRGRACTRRLFYLIPKQGEPKKILSAIEPLLLDHLPGEKLLYTGIKGQKNVLSQVFKPGMKIACQYSPDGNVPTVSTMDGGLVEYIKSFGVELICSADLMQYFGAVLTDEQIESHRQAGVIIHRILDNTFKWIRESVDKGEYIDEWAMLQKMNQLIANEPIHMDPPFFGVDDHASDPGYEPEEHGSYQIKEGSRIIIDISGRLPKENAVYYDVSWCMNVGTEIDPEYQRIFDMVNEARQLAWDMIQTHLDENKPIRGCDVDARLQAFFAEKGVDKYLMHRTGHNIGHECHGIGANLDDFETHDVRTLLPCTMFSVEPGIYTEKIGVRLEYDVHITKDKKLAVYGPVQKEILVI